MGLPLITWVFAAAGTQTACAKSLEEGKLEIPTTTNNKLIRSLHLYISTYSLVTLPLVFAVATVSLIALGGCPLTLAHYPVFRWPPRRLTFSGPTLQVNLEKKKNLIIFVRRTIILACTFVRTSILGCYSALFLDGIERDQLCRPYSIDASLRR